MGFLFSFYLFGSETEFINQLPEQPTATHLTFNNQDLEKILAPIRDIPDEEIRKLIIDNKINHPFFKIISKYPKLISFTIKLLKDPKALVLLISISKQKNRLIVYVILIILSMLLNYYQKQRINRNFQSLYQRIPLHLLRMIFVNLARILLFIFIFYQQLKPTIDIVYSL